MTADPSGPSAPAPILEVQQAVHAYGSRAVLRGVDLVVSPGEIYGLLGPNGAGKTTLVRAICGRLKPDGGRVTLSGGDPYRDRHVRAALGLAPQEVALYDHLTVRENLQVFARLSGVKRGAINAAVDEAMSVTRTLDRAHVPIRHLSGGYQRRVNIAAAVLHHPRLLILDEPTVGIDVTAREAVDAVIRDLASGGVAVLMVTHDLDQAGELATRVGFLREGRMVREGAPAALIAEAFGEQMEVQVRVAGDIDAGRDARLTSAGLRKVREDGLWTCLVSDGYDAAARIDARLKSDGLLVREIRVRQPSLQNLFSLIADERQAA